MKFGLQSRAAVARRSCVTQALASRAVATRGVDTCLCVTFEVVHKVKFGEQVAVIGLDGTWDPKNAARLHWHAGHRWTGEIPVSGMGAEFKFCVIDDKGTILEWEHGDNRVVDSDEVSTAFRAPPPEEEALLGGSGSLRESAGTDSWHEPGDGTQGWGMPHSAGVCSVEERERSEPHELTLATVEVPEWARDAVWYQIFPMGFFDCPRYNNHEGEPTSKILRLRHWYDHLERLGVGVVLFNPLFESDTHGYDTTDYYSIDRRLGTVEHFREIVKELHDRNIRVVLDGVFNHTGRNHFAFKDCRQNGLSSVFSGWYRLREGTNHNGDPFQYEAWEGHDGLPVLNHDSAGVRTHLFDVARFWLGDVGIDGWRLDVAHEIDNDFWRDFAKVCKAANPDSLLLGEMIHDDYRKWVAPGVLQSGTNYQLWWPMWHSLATRNYGELAESIWRKEDIYRGLHLLEFVGNHDVPRIASRLREQPAHFHLAMASLILAARGMPCMYYGDEWGLEGWGTKDGGRPEDLDLRPPAPEWRDEHQEAKARSIGMMTALRTQHRQLFSTGTCTVVANTQEQIALLRSPIDGRGPSALLLFNCADEGVESFPEEAMHHRCGNMTFWRHLCFTNGAQVHGGAQASFHEGRLHVEGGLPPNSVAVFISELY